MRSNNNGPIGGLWGEFVLFLWGGQCVTNLFTTGDIIFSVPRVYAEKIGKNII